MYRRVQLTETGEGRIRSTGSQTNVTAPLRFALEVSPVDEAADLKPLSLDLLHDGDTLGHWSAFADGVGEHTVVFEDGDIATPEMLRIEAQCLVPLNCEWRVGGQRGYARKVDASNLFDHVRADLHSALQSRESFRLTVDAGAFGRLSLVLEPPVQVELVSLGRDPAVAPRRYDRLARWSQVSMPSSRVGVLGARDIQPWWSTCASVRSRPVRVEHSRHRRNQSSETVASGTGDGE